MKLPWILSKFLFIWKALTIDQSNAIWSMNNIKIIRETMVLFMSSLAKSKSISFTRAVVLCWDEYKRQQKLLSIEQDPHPLIDFLMNINNYTINDIICNMHRLIQHLVSKNNKVRIKN